MKRTNRTHSFWSGMGQKQANKLGLGINLFTVHSFFKQICTNVNKRLTFFSFGFPCRGFRVTKADPIPALIGSKSRWMSQL